MTKKSAPPPPTDAGLDDRFFRIHEWANLIREGAFDRLAAWERFELYDWWKIDPDAAAFLREYYRGSPLSFTPRGVFLSSETARRLAPNVDRRRSRFRIGQGAGKQLAERLFLEQSGRCDDCGDLLEWEPVGDFAKELRPSFDHIVPLSAGGADSAENLRLVHKWCNASRSARATGLTIPPPWSPERAVWEAEQDRLHPERAQWRKAVQELRARLKGAPRSERAKTLAHVLQQHLAAGQRARQDEAAEPS